MWEWEVYECVEKIEYGLVSTDVSKVPLYGNSSLGFGRCIYSSGEGSTETSRSAEYYSEYEFNGERIIGKGTKYTYNTSQYSSTIGKYYISHDGKTGR